MRLLLDTHVWVWSLLEPARLSRRVRVALGDAGNEFWVSPVSVWELVMLTAKGRLTLLPDVERWVERAMDETPIQEAAVTNAVAIETRRLKLPHSDPADHLIAATARVFELTLVTADQRLLRAGTVRTMKAN